MFPATNITNSKNSGQHRSLVPVLFFVAIAISFTALYCVSGPTGSFSLIISDIDPPASIQTISSAAITEKVNQIENEGDELEIVLKAAAMEGKTVILSPLNAAWTAPGSFLDIYLESINNGIGTKDLLKHLIFVCLDQKAYNHCKSLHKHCYALVTEGIDFSGERKYMTSEYLTMVWRKIELLRIVLEKGYNFVFSDVDIVWFRNPLSQLYSEGDFQISCDNFLGNATDIGNWPNSGFMSVKANKRTIAFFKHWYATKDKYPKQHDQNVLNMVLKADPTTKDIGVDFRFLSTNYYGGMCEPSKDLGLVCTMHANCCFSSEQKLRSLKMVIDDWKNYLSLPPGSEKSQYTWSWKRQKH